MKIESGVIYSCDNGGNVIISGTGEQISNTGIENGYVYWDDVYLDVKNDVSLDLDQNDMKGVLEHERGKTIIRFGIYGRNGDSEIELVFKNLKSNERYKFLYNGDVLEEKFGKTMGLSNDDGELKFEEVMIPYEQH